MGLIGKPSFHFVFKFRVMFGLIKVERFFDRKFVYFKRWREKKVRTLFHQLHKNNFEFKITPPPMNWGHIF